VFKKINDVNVSADTVIDFSHPSLTEDVLNYCAIKKLPVVVATTGLSKDVISKIEKTSKMTPVFYSANMSMGVNLISELAKKAAQILGSDFDIEIVEKHHNQKIDAPSGTALMLADSICEVKEKAQNYVFDRHSVRKKRDKNEIGIHAVRGGTIVGEHDVIFAGRDEVITISHTAYSKEIFAVGAVNASVFLISKAPQIYSMKNMIQ